MDQQAATLLATLRRTSAASESKLSLLNNLKSDIKHHRVPESAQPIIFECLKYAISQQTSSTLATAGLTTFSHLIKRLKIQDAEGAAIVAHAPKLWPALLERLGDLRETHRAGASQALSDLWPFCAHQVEDLIRDDAITGSNARAKDAAMQWVVKMNHDASLPFKGFVPHMVMNLEDSDGTVRDSAKLALIELFKHAPDRAKADLKKQLNLHNVRTGIAAQVLTQIESSAGPEIDMTSSTRSVPTFDPHFTESINSEAARPPPPEEIPMDPIFLHSQRELDEFFRDMLPWFEGKESEENWTQRDKSVTKLRRLLKGNAPTDYYNVFMAGIKQLQEGIMKVANSLRTTTSTNGCLLVQELARTLGPALDPMVEIYLQSFIKMSAATKNIAAQNGNHTVDTLFQYASYTSRTMQHIWNAAQDKNVQPRTFVATWLCTVISRQTGSKTHFDHSGGLELAEKTIKKGLNDPQPKVKESMRGAYWTFAKTWPDKAAAIMNTLDAKAKIALERDARNPNAPLAPPPAANLHNSATSRAQSRASVRDAILAARKNLGKSQNDRPSSAMAAPTLQSPAHSKSTNNLSVRQPSATTSSSSRVPSNSSNARSNEPTHPAASTMRAPNSLMSGAARRPMKKPEPPRPATADPYASRRLLRPETPSIRSPANSPRQDTIASLARAAAASAARKKTEGDSPATTPIRQFASPKSSIPSPKPFAPSPKPFAASPRTLPRSRPSSKDSKASIVEEPSFTKEEDLTMVMPTRVRTDLSPVAVRTRPNIDKTFSVDSGIPSISADDDPTEVQPPAYDGHQPPSPIARRTLSRSMSEQPTQVVPQLNACSSTTQLPSEQSYPNNSVAAQAKAPSEPRQGSPLKTSTTAPMEDFQIHEDASNGRPNGPLLSSPTQEPRVLNELPLNESSQPSYEARENSISEERSASQTDDINQSEEQLTALSPESKAEVIRSRKLLISGIERIKSHTLDPHGFRKVLDLVRSSDSGDVFGSVGEGRRFDDLCSSLLEYVVEPVEPANGNPKHTQELKRQAIIVLRALFNKQQAVYKKWLSSGRWYQRCLASVFDARKSVEGSGLLVKDLETLSSEIIAKVQPDEGEEAILAWLDQDQHVSGDRTEAQENGHVDQRKGQSRATALALRTLASLLSGNSTAPVNGEISSGIARTTAVCLRSNDAEVRKAAVELATELHGIWPSNTEDAVNDTKGDFWSLLEKSGVQESARNLIVYFIARRARSA